MNSFPQVNNLMNEVILSITVSIWATFQRKRTKQTAKHVKLNICKTKLGWVINVKLRVKVSAAIEVQLRERMVLEAWRAQRQLQLGFCLIEISSSSATFALGHHLTNCQICILCFDCTTNLFCLWNS